MRAGRFVAVGDSFTEGVGDPNLHYPNGFRGWADRVAKHLGHADPRWEYANLALRSRVLAQVVADQVGPALALEPTLLSLAAGGNDLLAPRCDVEELLGAYDAVLGRVCARVPAVLTFTVFDHRRRLLAPPLRRRLDGFNAGVRALAAAHGALLVDHALLRDFDDRRLWAADKIHLGRHGHKRMAAVVLDELEVPYRFGVRDAAGWERRPWAEALREEAGFLRHEVVPLVRARVTGRRESDSASPKWPVPVRPADGLKRQARRRARLLAASAAGAPEDE